MKIEKGFSLRNYNAFKAESKAKHFSIIGNIDDLISIVKKHQDEKFYILGSGSNTLFTKDFDGVVLKTNIKGIKLLKENDSNVILEIGAGESWNGLVQYAVNNGFSGIENADHPP